MERARSTQDERVRVLNLTEQGRELKLRAQQVPNAIKCKVDIELDEMLELKRLCEKILTKLD